MSNYISQINLGDNVVRDIKDSNEAKTRGALGAKNLVPNDVVTETINGITFTVNDDGSVTANGTATDRSNFNFWTNKSNKLPVGSYIINGCPSGGSNTSYRFQLWNQTTSTGANDFGEGADFTISDATEVTTLQITVFSGVTVNNLTFYPMIRLATDTDPTYWPYTKTNYELMKYVDSAFQATGGINQLENTASTQTVAGGTFTVESDKSVTVNGTFTGFAQLVLHDNLEMSGSKIVSSKSADQNVFMNVYDLTTSSTVVDVRKGSATIDFDGTHKYRVRIVVMGAMTVNNVKIYPMITEASITNTTYQPYAMTNYELTKAVESGGGAEYYLDQDVILSTHSNTAVTFTDSKITEDSVVDVYTTVETLPFHTMAIANGSCTIIFPQQENALNVTVRIYIK